MKCRTKAVVIRLILPGILYFLKYSAAHCLLNQCVRTGLRAKHRFLNFARKIQSPVTGKMLILEICP
ncbi:MAG TPA: hypothetical protein DHV90_09045 [Lactobacillus sp.]|nr:hypothetical protein [Lactobacillus sp.]